MRQHRNIIFPGQLAIVAALLLMATPLLASTQTFYFQGVISTSGFGDGPLATGTAVTGHYSFDDATADSNGDSDLGTYATGELFVDLSDAGTISFDMSPTTSVNNDVEEFFPGYFVDSFAIRAGGGTQSTTFTNLLNYGQSSLSYSQGVFGTPTALTGDALTDVPQVIGAPWDTNAITLNFANSGSLVCDTPFVSNCNVTIDLQELSDSPFEVPTMPYIGLAILAILLALVGSAVLRRHFASAHIR